MENQFVPTVGELGCERIRVAKGDIAAVDRCGCGMFQLHLAAFTLRLAPEALESLFETLGQAPAASAGAPLGRANARDALPLAANAARWSKS